MYKSARHFKARGPRALAIVACPHHPTISLLSVPSLRADPSYSSPPLDSLAHIRAVLCGHRETSYTGIDASETRTSTSGTKPSPPGLALFYVARAPPTPTLWTRSACFPFPSPGRHRTKHEDRSNGQRVERSDRVAFYEYVWKFKRLCDLHVSPRRGDLPGGTRTPLPPPRHCQRATCSR